MARSKSWLKKQKQKLRKKLSEVSKSEGVEIVKTHLDSVYENYSGLIGLIPDIEKRISECQTDLKKSENISGILAHDIREINEGLIKEWGNVLKEIKKVRDCPKVMKIFHAKRVVSKIKKLRKKYPDE